MTTLAQAFAQGRNIHATSRQRGYSDGLHGKPWVPRESDDMLSYSLGHAQGLAERGCCCGEMADRSR